MRRHPHGKTRIHNAPAVTSQHEEEDKIRNMGIVFVVSLKKCVDIQLSLHIDRENRNNWFCKKEKSFILYWARQKRIVRAVKTWDAVLKFK